MARGGGTTARDNPYTGPSRLAVPFPGDEPTEPAAAEPAHVDDDRDQEDDDGDAVEHTDDDSSSSTSTSPGSRRRSSSKLLSPPRSGDLSGALFAVIAWSWIVLPLVQGGPGRVRDVWRAKWLNTGPDGKRLG